MTATYKDLVVVLPGITGSVLQAHGRDVWSYSVPALWNALTTGGASFDLLELKDDDPEEHDLGDGVQATRLIRRAHALPGLHKNVGYGPLVDALLAGLDAKRGYGSGADAGNFFEFPYDWRRDNRVAAHGLRRLIDARLPAWREASGAHDAKVVLVAHSMGGLVARYYLEVLGGNENCRALVTFGTPYRGAPNSLNFLAHGYKKMFVDLTDLMRSFTSVYQLLPRYPMVEHEGTVSRIAEAPRISGVDKGRAAAALRFHEEIDAGVELHQDVRYLIEPIVGMGQPTLQSARLEGGTVTLSRAVPPGWDSALGDGDGTVPRVSATPIELSSQFRESFIGERHAALQVETRTVEQLIRKLIQMQAQSISGIRAPAGAPDTTAVIALDVDDAYAASEPVTVRATTINFVDPATSIVAEIHSEASPAFSTSIRMEWNGTHHEATFDGLPAGMYRVTASAPDAFFTTANPVHDVFEVFSI